MLPTSGIVTLSSGLARTRIMASLIRKRSNLEWVSISIPCSALALALSLFFRDAAAKRVVPAIFLLALVAVAYLFGRLGEFVGCDRSGPNLRRVLVRTIWESCRGQSHGPSRVAVFCGVRLGDDLLSPQTLTLMKLAQKQFEDRPPAPNLRRQRAHPGVSLAKQ